MSDSTNQTQTNDAQEAQVDEVRAQLQRHLQLLAISSMMMDRALKELAEFLSEQEQARKIDPYVGLTELEKEIYGDFLAELKGKVHGKPHVTLEALVTTRSMYPGKFIGKPGPYPVPLMRGRDLGFFQEVVRQEIKGIGAALDTHVRCAAIEEPMIGNPINVK